MTEVDSRISKRRQNIPNIVLNKYLNNEDYLRIFLKMNPSDYITIQKNTDISPYWKPGLNFTLFSSDENKDPYYTKENKILEIEFDSLRAIRRKLRNRRKLSKDSIKINSLTSEIDSISSYITNKRSRYMEKAKLFEEEKQERTIQAFLDLTEIEIDDANVKSDLDCYFFQHSNNNEKGLMCLYPMDSLNLGKHELYFYKEVKRRSSDNPKITELKIPFYKVRDFD